MKIAVSKEEEITIGFRKRKDRECSLLVKSGGAGLAICYHGVRVRNRYDVLDLRLQSAFVIEYCSVGSAFMHRDCVVWEFRDEAKIN